MCVQEKLADPDFKPKEEGQTKEEAAWALCTWLYSEGILKTMLNDDCVQESERALIEQGAAFRVALPIVRVAPADIPGEGTWIRVEASGTERDTHGTRMSKECLRRFVTYAEEGIDGEPLPFLDGHYDDLLAAILGEIHEPYITKAGHFAIYVKLDDLNPHAVRLYRDLDAGKKHGASIAGFVKEYEMETWTDEDGEEQEDMLFHDVELVEVSRTTYPSWRPAFCDLVAKKLGAEDVNSCISRAARHVQKAVVVCTPSGVCTQLVQKDGRVNVNVVYGLTLALTRLLAPETVAYEPESILGDTVFESGYVHRSAVLEYAGSDFTKAMQLEEVLSLCEEVARCFETHLLIPPPLAFMNAFGRGQDKLAWLDLMSIAITGKPYVSIQEVKGMAKKGAVQETPAVEEEVTEELVAPEDGDEEQVALSGATTEEVVENDAEGATEEESEEDEPVELSRGELEDTVDSRMLGYRFAEATWAMQDLVWDALYSDAPLAARISRAHAVIAEFAALAITIVDAMVQAGYVPASVDELRQLSVSKVEMSEARISESRAQAVETAVVELAFVAGDLLDLVRNAEVPAHLVRTEPVVETQTETDNGDPASDEEEAADTQVREDLETQMASLATERQSKAQQIVDLLTARGNAPAEPGGDVTGETEGEGLSPEEQAAISLADIQHRWEESMKRPPRR